MMQQAAARVPPRPRSRAPTRSASPRPALPSLCPPPDHPHGDAGKAPATPSNHPAPRNGQSPCPYAHIASSPSADCRRALRHRSPELRIMTEENACTTILERLQSIERFHHCVTVEDVARQPTLTQGPAEVARAAIDAP